MEKEKRLTFLIASPFPWFLRSRRTLTLSILYFLTQSNATFAVRSVLPSSTINTYKEYKIQKRSQHSSRDQKSILPCHKEKYDLLIQQVIHASIYSKPNPSLPDPGHIDTESMEMHQESALLPPIHPCIFILQTILLRTIFYKQHSQH